MNALVLREDPFLKIKYFSWKKFFLNNILIKMAVFQTQSFGVDRQVKKHNSPCYFKPWGIKMELEKIRFRWMIFYQWFWIHHELSKERNQLGSNIGWFVKMVYVDIFRIKISTYCAEVLYLQTIFLPQSWILYTEDFTDRRLMISFSTKTFLIK
jgi:hypothetical protein